MGSVYKWKMLFYGGAKLHYILAKRDAKAAPRGFGIRVALNRQKKQLGVKKKKRVKQQR